MMTHLKKWTIISLVMLAVIPSYGQSLNTNWESDLSSALNQFLACKPTSENDKSCNKFIGQSLNIVYKINDFYSDKLGRHMLVDEISEYLKSNGKWKLLGRGYEQAALTEAQNSANAKKAVVAVYVSPQGIGHVVLILPGELQKSGTWGFDVPNSASFFPVEPDKSYINKGLSYGFAKHHIKDVLIYSRNY